MWGLGGKEAGKLRERGRRGLGGKAVIRGAGAV